MMEQMYQLSHSRANKFVVAVLRALVSPNILQTWFFHANFNEFRGKVSTLCSVCTETIYLTRYYFDLNAIDACEIRNRINKILRFDRHSDLAFMA